MSTDSRNHSYWLSSGDFELATHAHLPGSGTPSMAVLLCNTVGFEAIHAYRSMVRLGNALAETGLAAFRFDFAGTGNSSGDAEAADLVAAWRQNIVDQVRDLKKRWGFKHVAVVGFRLGAPLAASVVGDLDIAGITLWEPVTRGRSFVRETQAVAQFAEDQASGESGIVESGGFVFTAATMQAIGELSLDPITVPADTPVLLISRGRNAKFNAESFENRNPFEELRSREYDRMVCEPHYTELPQYSIAHMQHWHSSLHAGDANGLSRPEPRHTARVDISDEGHAVEESMFRTTDGALFGIVSGPAGHVPGSTPTLVLSNAGSVCSIGPNRIYVQTARALAAAGMEVVRFDLHNLGDSVTGDVDAANAPYPDTATEDVGRVLAHCRASFGSTAFVLAGLCSGSHTAYHFALDHDDPDVKEIVLMNPLTYYYTPGMSLDNPLQYRTVRDANSYRRSARQADNWRRLLTGRINYRRLVGFAMKVLLRLARNGVKKATSLWTDHPPSQMDEDLLRLQQRGVRVTYVFSDTDPGYWIARVGSPSSFRSQIRSGESKTIFIEDADHTMSRARNRRELVMRLREHLLPESGG